MGKLPVVSGKEAIAAFERLGWRVDHQTGSHVIMYRAEHPTLSVPRHKELAPGLLRGVLRRAGVTVDDFILALK